MVDGEMAVECRGVAGEVAVEVAEVAEVGFAQYAIYITVRSGWSKQGGSTTLLYIITSYTSRGK